MNDKQETHLQYEREEELAGTQRIIVNDANAETATLLGDHDIVLIPTPTNSPNDPLNWSPWRKYWHSALVLFITAFTAAISNDAGSAGDAIADDLGISYSVQNTAAGVLFLAIGYWTLLASPMPRLWGRRIQYLVCLLSGLGGSIWFAKIQTRQDTIWNQLFVGASEGCAEALVQLSLSDLFFAHQRGGVLGVYILATSIGTFLGPLIAGYIAADDWRWVGWWGAIICGGTFLVFLFGLEETSFNREEHLSRRLNPVLGQTFSKEDKLTEERSNEPTGTNPDKSMPNEALQSTEKRLPYLKRIALITPSPEMVGLGLKQYMHQLWLIARIFTFPAVLYSGLQWGAQDAWLSFYLTVEEDNYYGPPWNYSDTAVSVMNVPTLIGAIIGCIYGGWFSDVFVRWMAKRRNGISEAEDRLWLLLPSAVINPAGLMLFGIGSARGWSWPGPYIGLGMIGFGWGCAGDLSMAYLMDAYPEMVLEGMVGVAVVNNSLACIFTFVSSKVPSNVFSIARLAKPMF
nr:putative mfs-type transporter [Quercus suber]